MKTTHLLLSFAVLMIATSCKEDSNSSKNPLLGEYTTPYQTPPFDKIALADYKPAFKAAIGIAKTEVNTIADNSEEPTFANTIEALDNSGAVLDKVSNIFFNLNEANTDSTMQSIAQEVSPILSDFSNDINLNEKLFARVKVVYDKRNDLGLNAEQLTLVEKSYRGFVKNGANLDTTAKSRFREVSRQLSELSLKFNNNVMAETNSFILHLTDKKDLAGLTEGATEAAAMTAKEKNLTGWVFTLQQPSFLAFMKYSDNRDLRKQLYMAYSTRGIRSKETDNREVIRKIVNLRLETANLLGFKSYADLLLQDRMAESADKVNTFLADLLVASKPVAINDVKEVEDYAHRNGFKGKIERWDWSYYSEKLRDEKYSLSDELLKPYFQLDRVRQGIFDLTTKLYGLTYKENKSIPVYAKDVTAYEVYNEAKQLVAIFYLDPFPREGKSQGAWMTSYRKQHKENGENVIPFIQVVTNFTKPTETKPALLTHYEVTTFLHEFGHALHGMLSDGTYNSLTGTSVYRDFVELPSQIMENWALEKEWLDMFAVHYKTGEKIPAALVQKIVESKNYLSGYSTVRQLSFGISDMSWHSITTPLTEDIMAFEQKSMAQTELFPVVPNTAFATAFGHIFAGGYAAGYYSYKWAEVLEADAFSQFEKNGIFDRATAESFRKNILSKGGSEHPMKLYVRFRGQEPTIDALLKKAGLDKK
ncbi:M3 family metallopeptidase [Williamwhitmania taraxaci]|uniref:Peptidyl-dipeptidase Dcp Metallo peptidase. MEROPS family M03A n=1 Tax=Williamwhitmania taraxaci TaxID=1640674 RepID=A0A1G6NCL9_9BACT|nr:M3 family metallopeptidase [Williamwhitmania taraxaci]SDC65580.1 peptidyl-dipeptidase Dcp Metallo peptidase. MEROPS family M03A [Williamwhitmania taraxaci]